jgi:outer membrane usher protein
MLMAVVGPVFAVEEQAVPIVLPVKVNGVAKGEFACVLAGEDVLVRVTDLEAAGIEALAGKRVRFENEEYLSLASLRPAVRFSLDSESLTLAIELPAELLGKTPLTVGYGRPADLTLRRDTSVFLNYSLDVTDSGSLTAFGEAGASAGLGLWYTSVSRLGNGTWVRGQTNLTVDDQQRLRRWIVGDTVANSGELGGTVYLAGVAVGRDFSLDPYFVRFPTVELGGALTTPSRVDVYVNGQLVRQEQLPPGLFQLKELPVPAGQGEVKVVIRDAFGQEREIVSPFYVSTELLAPGLSEYRYALGFRRKDLASESFSYGDWVFLGRHRWGWKPWLTLEGRLEAEARSWSMGGGLTVRLPVGELGSNLAASKNGDASGYAGALTYRYLGRPFSAGLTLRQTSRYYSNASLKPDQDRPSQEAQAFAGVSFGRASVAFNYALVEMRDSGERSSLSVSSSWTTAAGTLVFSAGRRREAGRWTREAFVGWSYSLGRLGVVGASARKDDGATSASLNLTKPLPWGPGFGYRVQAERAQGSNSLYGVLQAQNALGRCDLTVQQRGGASSGDILLSGGLVWIAGRVLPTRQVGQGFALLRVPGVSGVTGLLNNQPVGKTDRHGDLLIPELAPYYGNLISIKGEEVPLDYALENTRMVLAPPYRGGAVALFPVQRMQTFRGRVVILRAGGERVPRFGQVTIKDQGGRARITGRPRRGLRICEPSSRNVRGPGRRPIRGVPIQIDTIQPRWCGGGSGPSCLQIEWRR